MKKILNYSKKIKFAKFFHILKKKKKKAWENFAVKIFKDSYKWQQYTQIIFTSFILLINQLNNESRKSEKIDIFKEIIS